MTSNPETVGASEAVGRRQQNREWITRNKAEALASTLDLDGIPNGGTVLPPAWHWIYFNSLVRRREVGADGHPRLGSFLPDVGLPRRMWAGGRIVYHAPLKIGVEAERQSEIVAVSAKKGRAGRLLFVTVRHQIFADSVLCIEEEQDIVYREPLAAGASAPPPTLVSDTAESSEIMKPDPVLLFRYSALTLNGHRIHYDRTYARQGEGYPDLVVHGPLIATLLHGLAVRSKSDVRLFRFDYRGMAPLFVDQDLYLEAGPGGTGDELKLWARGSSGGLAMQAQAIFV
ncbi:HTD2 family dehydratase [Phyllobacterium sp. K27]